MRHLIYLTLVLSVVAGLLVASIAQAPVIGPAHEPGADLRISAVGHFYDDSGRKEIEEIVTEAFAPGQTEMALGYSSGRHWFRLDLTQPETVPSGRVLIQFGMGNLDDVRLHYRDASGAWKVVLTGDQVPLAQRPLQLPTLGFLLAWEEIAGQSLYLSVQSVSTIGVYFRAGEYAELISHLLAIRMLYAIFVVLLVLGLVATGWLYLRLNDPVFLIFAGSQATYLVASLSYFGYLGAIFPTMVTDRITTFWLPLSYLTSMIFHLSLFRAMQVDRRVLRAGLFLLLAQIAVIAMQGVLHSQVMLEIAVVLTGLFVLVILLAIRTMGESSILPRNWARSFYAAYATTAALWILPVLGLMPVLPLTIFMPAIQGGLTLVLAFLMLVTFFRNQGQRAARAQAALQGMRLEAEVQARLSRAYRDLLWTVSHEVGTTVTVLRLGLSSPSVSAVNHQRMDRALDGLERLVEDFSRTERLELGDIRLTPSAVDAAAILREEADRCRQDAAEARFLFSGATSLPIRVDELYFRLVLSNLLSNAMKYCSPGTPVWINLRGAMGQMTLEVENDCPSASLPDAERVFDAFYRAPQVLAKPGSGLGLYIVRQLLKLLGGGCKWEVLGQNRVRVTAWLPMHD